MSKRRRPAAPETAPAAAEATGLPEASTAAGVEPAGSPDSSSPADPAISGEATRSAAMPIVDAEPTRCPRCGSAERDGYHNVRTQDYGGTTPDGRTYQRTTWRRTRCRGCGQVRIDRMRQ